MDRDKLICAHFDAFTDLHWVTNLEPEFKAAHLDAGEMEEYREAWRWHAETRDWDWWLEKVKNIPNAELQREIAECHAQIDTFRKGMETDRDRFQRIMAGKDEKQPVQQVTKDRGKGDVMMQVLLVISVVIAALFLLWVLGLAVGAGYGWILRYKLWRARRRVEEAERQLVEAFRDRREIDNEQSTASP